MPILRAEELTSWCRRIFAASGIREPVAARVSESLVESNLAGHDSHGVIRVPMYLEMVADGRVDPHAEPRVVRETAATAVVDGGWQFGQVTARFAMGVAIAKARGGGVGVVQLYQSGHVGRLGEWAAEAIEQGMIGIVTVNNHGGGQALAPFGGVARRLTPSPLAIGVPGGPGFPLLLDMTTSVTAEGKIRVKKARKQTLPEGWIQDAAGRPSTRPEDFYGPPAGSLLPLGGPASGYKGFGLAFMIDILSGALGGAGCSRAGNPPMRGNSVFLQALDPAAFGAAEQLAREAADLVAYVKSSPTAPGVDRVLVPGEVEHETRQARLRDGIPIEEDTFERLKSAADRLGLTA